MASRRLAAMGIKSGGGGDGSHRNNGSDNGSGSGLNSAQFIAGASAPPLSGEEGGPGQDMRALLDMGFPRDEAQAALRGGGSLEEAVARLSS